MQFFYGTEVVVRWSKVANERVLVVGFVIVDVGKGIGECR